METLGDKIKQLRDKLTQEELATILQIDRSTLASWEVNRREPDIETLCRLADFFKVTVDWLVGHKPISECLPPRPSLIHESPAGYQDNMEDSWQRVIATAEKFGFNPHVVCEILELQAKISTSIKKGCKDPSN